MLRSKVGQFLESDQEDVTDYEMIEDSDEKTTEIF